MTDISSSIRLRLLSENKRFFANDNISQFIKEDELNLLIDETTEKFQAVLRSLIIDVDHDPNSKGTARRLAKMMINELLAGRYIKEPDATAFPNEGDNAYTGMLVVRSEIKSVCSHHWQPVNGTAYIGIIPSDKVIGLSKYSRLAQWIARRGTLQEDLCVAIKNVIVNKTGSQDVAVHIEATHGCCENRGIMAKSSLTQTTVLSGDFLLDPSVKKEFFDNIKLQKSSFICK